MISNVFIIAVSFLPPDSQRKECQVSLPRPNPYNFTKSDWPPDSLVQRIFKGRSGTNPRTTPVPPGAKSASIPKFYRLSAPPRIPALECPLTRAFRCDSIAPQSGGARPAAGWKSDWRRPNHTAAGAGPAVLPRPYAGFSASVRPD